MKQHQFYLEIYYRINYKIAVDLQIEYENMFSKLDADIIRQNFFNGIYYE